MSLKRAARARQRIKTAEELAQAYFLFLPGEEKPRWEAAIFDPAQKPAGTVNRERPTANGA
jgi:hypothetical protein